MKNLKPLQLFMELRKPSSAKCWVLGLTFTPRHVCMAVVRGDHADADHFGIYPHQTKCIVETLSGIPMFDNKVQHNDEETLLGILVVKKHVGADILIDDLCKMEKFKNLKYSYWVDNIKSANSESASKAVVEDYNWRFRGKSKEFLSAFLMLQQYMDFWNTMVERPKEDFIAIPSDSEYPEYDEEDELENCEYDHEEDEETLK